MYHTLRITVSRTVIFTDHHRGHHYYSIYQLVLKININLLDVKKNMSPLTIAYVSN